MNLLVLGAYGQKNTGDESLLLIFKKELEARGHCVVVNSHYPKQTQKQYQVKTVFTYPWKEPLKKLRVLRWCDAVVYGGGTILSQIPKMLFFMTLGNITAKLMGKKVAYIGVGVGNLEKSPTSQMLVRAALSFADLVTLRDKESYKQLKNINSHKKAKVTADPVLLLETELLKTGIKLKKTDKKPTVGISFRYMVPEKSYQKAFQSLVELSLYLIKKYKARVVILPIQHRINYSKNDSWQYDSETAYHLERAIEDKLPDKDKAKLTHLNKEYSPYRIQEIIGQFDLYITSPLHSLMFAALKNTPVIALDYSSAFNRKIEQFMSSIGQKDYYIESYAKCDFETLKQFTDKALKEGKKNKKQIAQKVEKLRKKAETNFDLLEKVLT